MAKIYAVFFPLTTVELIISRVQLLIQKNRGAQLPEIMTAMGCGGIALVSVFFIQNSSSKNCCLLN